MLAESKIHQRLFRHVQNPLAGRELLVLLLVTAVSIGAGWIILKNILLPRGIFVWDETGHALKSTLFAYDLRQRDVVAFLFDTYRQVLYPPLFYWFTGLGFLIFGQSVVSASLVSLVAYVLLAPILYLSGRLLQDNFRPLGGIVAAGLFLASPPLIWYATFSMLELFGLFALGIAIAIYLWLIRSDAQPRKYVLLGFGILFAYFTRIPYGIMLAITVVIAELVGIGLHANPKPVVRRLFFVALPMAIVLVPWFAYPPKIASTWSWLINTPTVPTPISLTALLYFPKQIVAFPDSIPLAALLLCSLFASARFVKDRRILFLITLVLVQFLLGELHHTKFARFMFPVLLPMFLLAGYMTVEVWQRSYNAKNKVYFLLPRLLTLLLFLHMGVVFVQALDNPQVTTENDYKVAPYIGEVVRDIGTTFVISSTDVRYPLPGLLDWYLIAESEALAPPQAGAATQIEEERKLAELLTRYALPQGLVNLLQPVFTRADKPGKTRTIQLGLPARASYSQSPEDFRRFFLETYDNDLFDGVVVVTSTGEQTVYSLDYIVPGLQAAGLYNVSSRVFEEANTRVDLFVAEENVIE